MHAPRITVSASVPHEARITFEHLPPLLARSRPWMESVAASMTAFYGATRRQGTVEVESADGSAGTLVLLFRWQ